MSTKTILWLEGIALFVVWLLLPPLCTAQRLIISNPHTFPLFATTDDGTGNVTYTLREFETIVVPAASQNFTFRFYRGDTGALLSGAEEGWNGPFEVVGLTNDSDVYFDQAQFLAVTPATARSFDLTEFCYGMGGGMAFAAPFLVWGFTRKMFKEAE